METTINFELVYSENFFVHIAKHKKAGQKQNTEKIKKFLLELVTHPTSGTGQVEPLKGYGERSVWSRRINQQHRLVYEVFEEEKKVKLLSAYGHYDDK